MLLFMHGRHFYADLYAGFLLDIFLGCGALMIWIFKGAKQISEDTIIEIYYKICKSGGPLEPWVK